MANPIVQYLKETRSELNHVAWPTQKQTVVFTALVAAISLGVAAYLGACDYVFTNGLGTFVNDLQTIPSGIQVTQQPVTPTPSPTTTQAPAVSGPTFTIPAAAAPSGSSK